MNYILSVSYANSLVAFRSYERLAKEGGIVKVFDNHYPLCHQDQIIHICNKYGFQYIYHGNPIRNVGQYAAYKFLLDNLPDNTENVIFYDGDNLPDEIGWTTAIFDILSEASVSCVTLSNDITDAEFEKSGNYIDEVIKGINCRRTLQPVTNTVCGFKMSFLKRVGGLTGGKEFYGGNEIEMFKHFDEVHKWVFLKDYRDDVMRLRALHDWQYTQYKCLYSFYNLNMSFEEYLKTNPERQDVNELLKKIFG